MSECLVVDRCSETLPPLPPGKQLHLLRDAAARVMVLCVRCMCPPPLYRASCMQGLCGPTTSAWTSHTSMTRAAAAPAATWAAMHWCAPQPPALLMCPASGSLAAASCWLQQPSGLLAAGAAACHAEQVCLCCAFRLPDRCSPWCQGPAAAWTSQHHTYTQTVTKAAAVLPSAVLLQNNKNSTRLCEQYVSSACLAEHSADTCIQELVESIVGRPAAKPGMPASTAVAITVPVVMGEQCGAGCMRPCQSCTAAP